MMRTHGAGDLRASHAGQTVTLAGWVHHLRDHKGVTFIDLRDASGSAQVVFHPDEAPDAAATARDLQREYVVRLEGEVARRPAGAENPKLPTGEIEVRGRTLEILSRSQPPPFLIEDGIDADESTRLHFRYVDLRRPELQRALRLRHRVTRVIRRELDEQSFVEIETPYLNRATPEGARDFLVPARIKPGSFFALLQSPQLFKQLLMVAGFERYYQIARCFRDEDLRADRQFEFTQLDMELSFVNESDVQGIVERLLAAIWRECIGVEIPLPFPRMPYADAIARFGTDKPDTRFDMELTDVSDVFAATTLGIFKRALETGRILAVGARGAGGLNHSQLKHLERDAMQRGAGGLAWVVFKEGGEVDSPLAKHLSSAERQGLAGALGIGPGDAAFMVADDVRVGREVLGGTRLQLGRELGLIAEGAWRFLWIVDPPLVEWSEDAKRFVAVHHPFTAPQPGSLDTLESDPASALARAYDVVVNGVELGGGSIRIHDSALQQRAFAALGVDPEVARREFGFLMEAFEYGPPPHGGIAFGLDRMAMLLAGAASVRDVIAFPKTPTGDLMTGAPTPVELAVLDDLGIRLKPT